MDTIDSVMVWMQFLLQLFVLAIMAAGAVLALTKRALFLGAGIGLLILLGMWFLLVWRIPQALATLGVMNGPPEWIFSQGVQRLTGLAFPLIDTLGWALLVLGILFLPRANPKPA